MSEKKKNTAVIDDGRNNKGAAFTHEERKELGIHGLLPYKISSQDKQVEAVIYALRNMPNDLMRYSNLTFLQDRNERLFYSVIAKHIEEILPIIYTPTVGLACKEFSHIFRLTKGFFITPEDKGEIKELLRNWPNKDVRVIVVTDGQRILGLGDLGANGMGIPIGKLVLYTACAGIHPDQCLPVMLDVGTNNEEFLNDELYIGYPHPRIGGEDYLELVEEFVMAVQEVFPKVLIQFEDFLTPNAYALLNEYKDRVLCFNDDIQGTAAVILAGVYASSRITGKKFSDLTIMFLGAGSAATGIADLMVSALVDEGLTIEKARKRMWFIDVNGLVINERKDLMEHNLPYAHENSPLSFIQAIDEIKPDVLIGATGAPGTFTEEVIEHMATHNERPVIFALSNPTSKAECTAEDAYRWSEGKAIFASGSPFAKVSYKGTDFYPGQGNNAYVFPGIGLGALAADASSIPDQLFLEAARALALLVKEEDIKNGSLYPKLTEIRELSLNIAHAVVEKAYDIGVAKGPKPENIKQRILEYMYDPSY